ncbi:hypothetical protein [uncultured Kordia sp.]|uniref:hypothetical protein n=1 Tax=uncultured Kordia sp. TaxID=507699 RepID=UPI00262FB400|nr:hypothetical protein [uncultured Kordia sp.]
MISNNLQNSILKCNLDHIRNRKDKYIYVKIFQNKNFKYFLNNNEKIKHVVKDSIILDLLFNEKEIENYKKQLTGNQNLKAIENYVISHELQPKPKEEKGRVTRIINNAYFMGIPVFSILMIYKKEDNHWKGTHGFMIGIS